MTEIEKEPAVEDVKMNEYPTIKLSMIIKMIIEAKSIAMYPKSESGARDKLYNRLTQLEYLLCELKDVNVELERDWWKE